MTADFAADVLAFIIFWGVVGTLYQWIKTGKWWWKK